MQQPRADVTPTYWVDDLSRLDITSGRLSAWIGVGLAGAFVKPSTVARDSEDPAYRATIDELMRAGASADQVVERVMIDDAQRACDAFSSVYSASGGARGWVALTVDPRLSTNHVGLVRASHRLVALVDRPNLMLSLPSTHEGLVAVTEIVAAGMSVAVSGVVSLTSLRAASAAYHEGLVMALAGGTNLSGIRGVIRADRAPRQQVSAPKRSRSEGVLNRVDDAMAALAYDLLNHSRTDPHQSRLRAEGANALALTWSPVVRSRDDEVPPFSPAHILTVASSSLNAELSRAPTPACVSDPAGNAVGSARQHVHCAVHAGVPLPTLQARAEADLLQDAVREWDHLVTVVHESVHGLPGEPSTD